ncbi:hypothetical protein AAKU52_002023 [Pedobacter sp. CG_S7]|uniref:hypothetical protein n=1 Tax=Pedobacter sp. CG_S7 TaxID=3143930 RepID=UPI0033984C0A
MLTVIENLPDHIFGVSAHLEVTQEDMKPHRRNKTLYRLEKNGYYHQSESH